MNEYLRLQSCLLALSLALLPLQATSEVVAAPQASTDNTVMQEAPDSDAETAADNGDEGEGADDAAKDEEEKTLASVVEGHDVYEGLFTLYRDPETGAVHMALREDQLGKEYIYFTHTQDGISEAGHYRGQFRDNAVFTIGRHFDRIEFVEENTHFYIDPQTPIARTNYANISPAVLGVSDIVAKSEDGKTVLINVDELFLSEALHQVAPTPSSNGDKDEFKVGKLSKKKSKILELKNYPQNTDVIVEYVYDNPKPKVSGSDAVTDARSVSARIQHTLIEMPENDYQPRFDDPRVGYFFTKVTDLTASNSTPYRDLIHRWHLKKKDPKAAISEPVEPITFWIENTTPLEYRDVIKDGVLAWNTAFEKAGFKNAIEVNIQPDDADWDAGDIRYNVIRWTSSPNPRFGGYGPSFVNPRTGQILGADIMMEQVLINNRARLDNIFNGKSLRLQKDDLQPDAQSTQSCSLGLYMQQSLGFAHTMLSAYGVPDPEKTRMVKEGLRYIALHEVGHTLGLNHNMKASQYLPFSDLHNIEKTKENGLVASVMDYVAVNIAENEESQGLYFTGKPGAYDDWAIEFGYAPHIDDPAERKRILSRSSEPQLGFGNDADDMRTPGRGIDPRIMIGDLSSDVIDFAAYRLKLIRDTYPKLKDRILKEGESHDELELAYRFLLFRQFGALDAASRYIGGVYVDRSFVGQDTSADAPYVPVPETEQKRAMEMLRTHLFAPDAFDIPADLIAHMQRQRRGFNLYNGNEDPNIHALILSAHTDILDHLLHPKVMQRITDSTLYGNSYEVIEVMDDLTSAIFDADLRGDVNSQRQNLQIAYITMLSDALSEKGRKKYDHVARSAILANLMAIDEMMDDAKRRGNAATKAHRQHVVYLIKQALYPNGKA